MEGLNKFGYWTDLEMGCHWCSSNIKRKVLNGSQRGYQGQDWLPLAAPRFPSKNLSRDRNQFWETVLDEPVLALSLHSSTIPNLCLICVWSQCQTLVLIQIVVVIFFFVVNVHRLSFSCFRFAFWRLGICFGLNICLGLCLCLGCSLSLCCSLLCHLSLQLLRADAPPFAVLRNAFLPLLLLQLPQVRELILQPLILQLQLFLSLVLFRHVLHQILQPLLQCHHLILLQVQETRIIDPSVRILLVQLHKGLHQRLRALEVPPREDLHASLHLRGLLGLGGHVHPPDLKSVPCS
mmetsp:Transcript_60765/g.100540  ORF Transcript_60765/g.100540 Transcript_60765/m.100540 type:complete len:293 (+) Transcript_60765:456-1334(+)